MTSGTVAALPPPEAPVPPPSEATFYTSRTGRPLAFRLPPRPSESSSSVNVRFRHIPFRVGIIWREDPTIAKIEYRRSLKKKKRKLVECDNVRDFRNWRTGCPGTLHLHSFQDRYGLPKCRYQCAKCTMRPGGPMIHEARKAMKLGLRAKVSQSMGKRLVP